MLNYKLCMIILHTLYITIKFQRALYCKLVESDLDTHVNEVSLGIYLWVSANTEKPR